MLRNAGITNLVKQTCSCTGHCMRLRIIYCTSHNAFCILPRIRKSNLSSLEWFSLTHRHVSSSYQAMLTYASTELGIGLQASIHGMAHRFPNMWTTLTSALELENWTLIGTRSTTTQILTSAFRRPWNWLETSLMNQCSGQARYALRTRMASWICQNWPFDTPVSTCTDVHKKDVKRHVHLSLFSRQACGIKITNCKDFSHIWLIWVPRTCFLKA